MSVFFSQLRKVAPSGRRWLYVPYDQLSDAIGPLSREPAKELGIVLVESPHKAARRPYHKQKLLTVLASQRHFALEQQARGVAVRYVVHDGSYADALASVASETGRMRMMRPAERELREELAGLPFLEEIAHEGWLSTRDDFLSSQPRTPWRMDRFYRAMRTKTGILMHEGKPLGQRWSLDADNRKPWRGTPLPPVRPLYHDDPVKDEVAALIASRYATHPGELHAEQLPARVQDVRHYWAWVQTHCLPLFGPFEDAMSTRAPHLFHTLVSPLVNLHRLLPRTLVDTAAALPLPLSSQEGFVRQVLGWREYVRHVHEETDGLRRHPDGRALRAREGEALPPAYWGTPSGLHCLDTVVADVWRDGYSHHITRLMVLSNIAQLIDASPQELSDWFWIAYADAYDWVVETNVLGMGTFAFGDLLTTKPYVSGAAYIHRMSDYCAGCAFDPRKNCPLTAMYWAYLARNEETLAPFERVVPALFGMRKRSAAQRAEDKRVFTRVKSTLARGERVTPEDS